MVFSFLSVYSPLAPFRVSQSASPQPYATVLTVRIQTRGGAKTFAVGCERDRRARERPPCVRAPPGGAVRPGLCPVRARPTVAPAGRSRPAPLARPRAPWKPAPCERKEGRVGTVAERGAGRRDWQGREVGGFRRAGFCSLRKTVLSCSCPRGGREPAPRVAHGTGKTARPQARSSVGRTRTPKIGRAHV